MTDKFIDPKTGKELFRIDDDNKLERTEEGKLAFLEKNLKYWEEQMEEWPTERTKESLELARARLKQFKEGNL